MVTWNKGVKSSGSIRGNQTVELQHWTESSTYRSMIVRCTTAADDGLYCPHSTTTATAFSSSSLSLNDDVGVLSGISSLLWLDLHLDTFSFL